MRFLLSAFAAAVAVAVTPVAATAQNCVAPPGTAAIEQYCETVPDAANRGQGTASERRRFGDALSRRDARRLERAGADGRSVLDLPAAVGARASGEGSDGAVGAATGGRGDGSGPNGGAGTGRRSIPPAAAEPSNNPLEAVVKAVGEGGGVSGTFGWLLMATALGAVAVGWTRLRRRPAS